jgi:hypothetical protein
MILQNNRAALKYTTLGETDVGNAEMQPAKG